MTDITPPEEEKKPNLKTALWRYNEDGTYNNKPLNPNYFAEYQKKLYDEKLGKKLGRTLALKGLKNHKKSRNCIKN